MQGGEIMSCYMAWCVLFIGLKWENSVFWGGIHEWKVMTKSLINYPDNNYYPHSVQRGED